MYPFRDDKVTRRGRVTAGVTSRRCVGFVVAVLVCWSVTPVRGQEPAQSLSRLVPADTNFFAELQQLSSLRDLLNDSGVWDAMIFLAGRSPDAVGPQNQAIRKNLGAILGIEIDEEIWNLFGEHVAIGAPDWERLGQGVVIMQSSDPEQLGRFLRIHRSKLRKTEDHLDHYDISLGLTVVTDGSVAIFGRSNMELKYFERSTALLAGRSEERSLSQSPRFVDQLSELPGMPLGTLFAEMPLARKASRSEGRVMPNWWPATWPVVRRIGVGLYPAEGGDGLDLALRGLVDRPNPNAKTTTVSPEVLRRLPESTLAAWTFSIDYLSAYQRAKNSGQIGDLNLGQLLSLVEMFLRSGPIEQQLLRHLGRQTTVVVGRETVPPDETGVRFDRPMLSVVVKSNNDPAVSKALGEIASGVRLLYQSWLAGQTGEGRNEAAPVPEVKLGAQQHDGVEISILPLGRILDPDGRFPFLPPIDLSWAVFDGSMVISSDPTHLKQLIDAFRSPEGGGFGDTDAYRVLAERGEAMSIVAGRPAEAARLFSSWLDYIETQHPEMMRSDWWHEQFQPPRTELGFRYQAPGGENGVLVVTKVLGKHPASGKLKVGDRIEGIDGKMLHLEKAELSFRAMLEARSNPKRVILRIRRGSRRLDVDLAIPAGQEPKRYFNPIAALQDLKVIGQPLSVVGYSISGQDPERFNADLVLRFTPQQKKPLVGSSQPGLRIEESAGKLLGPPPSQ